MWIGCICSWCMRCLDEWWWHSSWCSLWGRNRVHQFCLHLWLSFGGWYRGSWVIWLVFWLVRQIMLVVQSRLILMPSSLSGSPRSWMSNDPPISLTIFSIIFVELAANSPSSMYHLAISVEFLLDQKKTVVSASPALKPSFSSSCFRVRCHMCPDCWCFCLVYIWGVLVLWIWNLWVGAYRHHLQVCHWDMPLLCQCVVVLGCLCKQGWVFLL